MQDTNDIYGQDWDGTGHDGHDSAAGVDSGISSVMEEIHRIASSGGNGGEDTPAVEPTNRRGVRRGQCEDAYNEWLQDKTPENMSKIVAALSPTINSEVMRYSGSRPLLTAKAKALAVRAVKTFNPMSGARLQSWVVTNLKPLSRYSVKQRDIKIPEVAARQAAAVADAESRLEDDLGRKPTDEELSDELGISVKRVKDVRGKAMASVSSGSFDVANGSDDMSSAPGVVVPDKVPFAQEAVYQGLSPKDRLIFDSLTGSHGSRQMKALDVASMLHVSPAAVSARASDIADEISWIVNNG